MSSHSYKTILEKARIIKKTAEKEHKCVGTKWSYYIAKAILKPNTAITKISFETAPKPHGDSIKAKIYKADYLNVAKRLIAFVEKNKTLPNYVKWNDKKIRTRTYVYNLAKILVYYADHQNKYPAYNTINTDVWKRTVVKKYGHATEYGCNAKGQNNGYYCGCHSLQEVFRNLCDVYVSQSTIASVCGTTTDGTDHDGLNTCVAWFNRKYNKNLSVKWYNFSELGWSGIRKIINSNNQDCIIHNLYRNTWGHYEVINRIYDDYCDVQNSLGDFGCNDCYCGYTEERYLSTFKSYISGISQKSVMVITNES